MATDQAPNLKRFEFLTFMIWVALAGAVLILLIDYQIKASILKASERAWEGISALERQARGTNTPTDSNGSVGSGVRGYDGAQVEMGTLASPDTGSDSAATSNGQAKRSPRARNTRVQDPDSLGDK